MGIITNTNITIEELKNVLKDVKKIMNDENLDPLTQAILSEMYLNLTNTLLQRKRKLKEELEEESLERVRYV